jgi:hypothetical protein
MPRVLRLLFGHSAVAIMGLAKRRVPPEMLCPHDDASRPGPGRRSNTVNNVPTLALELSVGQES